jgi:hypothetical protein
MPVKKKVAGKGKKKVLKKKGKSDKSDAKGLQKAPQSELVLVKEFFLLQVNDLEARLKRSVRECDEVTEKYTVSSIVTWIDVFRSSLPA